MNMPGGSSGTLGSTENGGDSCGIQDTNVTVLSHSTGLGRQLDTDSHISYKDQRAEKAHPFDPQKQRKLGEEAHSQASL